MNAKHRALRFGFLMGLFVLIYGSFTVFVKPYYGLRVNVTSSLPQTLFLSFPIKNIQQASYVSFNRPDSPRPLVKEIRGLPGDPIDIKEGHVFVAGQDCGLALRVSQSGHIYAPTSYRWVPPGYVYVHSPHPESFDSRYEEFGLVKIEELTEQLWPLF